RAVDEAVLVAEVVEVQRHVREREQAQLDELRRVPAAQGDPVEPVVAEELVRALRHQHDVVAALAEVVVLSGTAAEDVVAADGRETCEQAEPVAAVAEHAAVVAFTVEDPVVAVAAEDALGAHRAVDEDVVARTAEVLDAVVATEQEVVAFAADDEVAA